jgi:hypothetical protein
MRVDVRSGKIIAKFLSQHDKKHVILTSLSGLRVGKRMLRVLGHEKERMKGNCM